VLEATETATELRMWQAESRAIGRVVDASEQMGRSTTRAAAWLGCARGIVLAVAGAGVAVMAAATATMHAEGTISGPTLALLILIPLALGETAAGLPDAGALAARTRAAEERLSAISSRTPAVSEPVVPVPAAEDTGVRADGVTVTWNGRDVLGGMSLALAAGERIGVVGPSGSGKSTLASLMMRFVDPSQGRVGLGGRDLSALALDDVRSRVGLVDDDPHVFASTLVENVRLARPGAEDCEVELALRRAGLGPWLDALPDGLDTWLGDGHAQVSGGERARLAIARSLLADQPVLVLDEPTAHLDSATAELLASEVLADDARSVLWITHGTVGLDRVDRVVDLQPT
jgi:ATP-binding cassette subfamily C protein CydCD